jgi:hypothetical protein
MLTHIKNWLTLGLGNLFEARMKRKKAEKKMSEILKEMALTLLKDPDAIPSSEAAHAALLLSHVAWNCAIGEAFTDAACRSLLEEFEKTRPTFWDELATRDWKAMVESLIDTKKRHYPDDTRVVVVCGMRDPGVVRVEWNYRDEPRKT